MIVLGRPLATLAVVAALMLMCGGAIGRLLWLFEGRPPLARPAWWPGTEGQAAEPAALSDTTAPSHFSAGAVACAACCGVPILLVAGVLSAGVLATYSLGAGALLALGLLAWAVATGRAAQWIRPLTRRRRDH